MEINIQRNQNNYIVLKRKERGLVLIVYKAAFADIIERNNFILCALRSIFAVITQNRRIFQGFTHLQNCSWFHDGTWERAIGSSLDDFHSYSIRDR